MYLCTLLLKQLNKSAFQFSKIFTNANDKNVFDYLQLAQRLLDENVSGSEVIISSGCATARPTLGFGKLIKNMS